MTVLQTVGVGVGGEALAEEAAFFDRAVEAVVAVGVGLDVDMIMKDLTPSLLTPSRDPCPLHVTPARCASRQAFPDPLRGAGIQTQPVGLGVPA